VINAIGTFLAAINAVMLGSGVYEGAVAAIITGLIGAALALANELFTRAEVVPIQPLQDLADAEARTAKIIEPPPAASG
jgi:hypothetical protein